MESMTIEEALLELKNHVTSVSKDGNRSLKVKCDSSRIANGLIYTYGIIFGHSNVRDSEFHFLGTDKYACPRFATSDIRDEAFSMTQDLIDGKTVVVSGGSVSAGQHGVVVNDPSPVVVVDEDIKKEKTDWTTYIVVGAAAVVILMLLWDRKKK